MESSFIYYSNSSKSFWRSTHGVVANVSNYEIRSQRVRTPLMLLHKLSDLGKSWTQVTLTLQRLPLCLNFGFNLWINWWTGDWFFSPGIFFSWILDVFGWYILGICTGAYWSVYFCLIFAGCIFFSCSWNFGQSFCPSHPSVFMRALHFPGYLLLSLTDFAVVTILT